jgi:serine/threonine-protein kinase
MLQRRVRRVGRNSMTEAGPKAIGRYKIRRELGRGMMGVVYEAEDTLLGRPVALKTIHLAFLPDQTEGEDFEKRFFTEARAAARLSHPGIVVVYDVGRARETGKLYMALEYLVGRTLEAALSGARPVPWREALRIAARVADALHHAHSHGIVHRDIKPGNIMLLESGQPKIMDFGIAKLPEGQLTTGGKFLGSPSYLSPERAAGEPVEGRSDIFSLGAVLYELLTGKRAFDGPGIPAILAKLASEDPPPPTQGVSGVPKEVDYVVARALAKDRNDRYTTAAMLAEDLDDILADRPPRHRTAWTAPPPAGRAQVSKDSVAPRAAAPRRAWASLADREKTARGSAGPTLALPKNRRVSIAILAGARQGEVLVLERPRVIIGRTGARANADVEIPDPEVSGAHATLECHGQRIVLRDLESRNGTFVGEARIREAEIENHGEFRLGNTRFMLILADLE